MQYLEDRLRYSKPVKRIGAATAAAAAFNHAYDTTQYEVHHFNYSKNGVVRGDSSVEGVGVDLEDVKLLEAGQFANEEPRNRSKKEAQKYFDKHLAEHQREVYMDMRSDLPEKLKETAIYGAIIVGALVFFGVGKLHDYQQSVVQNNTIAASNQQGRVVVDNTFSFLLPCTPTGEPSVTDGTDLKSSQVLCAQKDGAGATTFLYELENDAYKTSKYSPQDNYTNCAAYTGDNGERYTVIDNHIEDVHGIKFAICNLAGSSGTVNIIARAITGNTLQYVGLMTDQQHMNNVWSTFRGQLESFQYIQ